MRTKVLLNHIITFDMRSEPGKKAPASTSSYQNLESTGKAPTTRRTVVENPKDTAEAKDPEVLPARKLMDKFNPFFKRNLTTANPRAEGSLIEFARPGRKQHGEDFPEMEDEEKAGADLGRPLTVDLGGPRHRSTASQKLEAQRSPYRRIRGGDSFLDIYADAKFENLELPEIIEKLEANLNTFKKRKGKLVKDRDKAEQNQVELAKNQKSMSPEKYKRQDRELNEEIDSLSTQIYDHELRIKSLEELIKSLKNEAMLEEQMKGKDNEIARLRRKNRENKQEIAKHIIEVILFL